MGTHSAHLRAQGPRPIMSTRNICILIITVVVFLYYYYYYFYYRDRDMKYKKPFIIYPKFKKPKPPTCGIQVNKTPIIKVPNLKTYVVGSYVEHRLDVKTVRTIAIVQRAERAEYGCFFCCNGTTVTVTPATYDIHTDHFDFEYGTADILCTLPETCKTPTHMAITSGSPEANGSPENIQVLHKVRNQQVRDVFPYDFTICISVMFDFGKVLELVQALEMFKILGVQRVAIYKTSCSPDVQRVLDHYVQRGLVEIVPWTVSSYINVSRGWRKNVSPGQLHYFGQIAALNDCVYRYMYRSRYVALQDLDEMILPLRVPSWTRLLPELERQHGDNLGFEFENNYFLMSVTEVTPVYEPKGWKRVPGANLLQRVKRLTIDRTKFNNFKVIVNPRLVYSTSVHGLLHSLHGTVRVDSTVAHMYHFRNFTGADAEGTLVRDTRLRDFADALMPAVSTVLESVFGGPDPA